MGIFDFLKRGKQLGEQRTLLPAYTVEGMVIRLATPLIDASAEGLLGSVEKSTQDDVLLATYLAQLAVDGACEIRRDAIALSWPVLYRLLDDPQHAGVIGFLGLPPMADLRPVLASEGALSDPGFEVKITAWTDGKSEIALQRLAGAVATLAQGDVLLPQAAWEVVNELLVQRSRAPASRKQHENELSWGRLRYMADRAGALYASRYLETTLVLLPQTLRLPLTKEETPFGRVVTVAPTFEQAPDGWLKAFDGYNSVQPHYDLTRNGGRVRIVISEPVRQVLEVIKRDMPGRKVAGARAEKFIHNPWAFLGDAAHEVLDEENFAADRAGAGALAAVFSIVARVADGNLNAVDLVVTEHFSLGTARTTAQPFDDPAGLETFIHALELALDDEHERFGWQEFDLSIDADSTLQLEQSRQFLHVWRSQPSQKISYEDIYELDGYSTRIEGIGIARPIYVPVVQKPASDDSGWLPDELVPLVQVTLPGQDKPVLLALGKEWLEKFEQQVIEAEKSGQPQVQNDSLPTAIGVADARALSDNFRSMLDAQSRIKEDGAAQPRERKGPKNVLLVKTNFHGIDYAEERRSSLALPAGSVARLPRCLRTEWPLKQHQLDGVAWFQHLVSKAPSECRGALLADDMGLGKTLQLLTVLAWYYERYPHAAPSVIFAPKSLLENWSNETGKFFTASFPEKLVLYGDALRSLKQPLSLIDEQVKEKGIVDLLKPNWVGNAKLILTTYEVLTAYEFSFARQPFAFVICDEAQRIKTPGTRVTLAVKKLKADFRVACTGTPVENNLADLWCLFDFVQPGLLGALEAFGQVFRKPIEANTEQEKDAVSRLQNLIAPQTLRRTKASIAGLLKKKFFAYKKADATVLQFKECLDVDERLEIAMTDYQRVLYQGGLKKLQDAATQKSGKKRAQLSFGALHLMRAVCAEPYCLPGSKFLKAVEGHAAHLGNSPKLAWMLEHLRRIEIDEHKAIIFTELREVQIALAYFLHQIFGLKVITINGDSDGRQSSIDKFSATPGFNVIILSTLAAGAGLNVTAANHVFHFTRAWNPAKEAQATDRAFRIGQEKDVYVYCPTIVDAIGVGFATFEVRLDALLKRKAGLADATLDKNGLAGMLNGSGGDVTFDDLAGGQGGGAEVPAKFLTLDDVDRLDGWSFEVFCSVLWYKQGYLASPTAKAGGDGGIDVVALKGRDGELLQCKSSIKADIGWDAIKEVTAGAARYQTRYTGTRMTKVAVTNQRFTSGALIQAEANQVRLVMRGDLENLLGAYPTTDHELTAALLAFLTPGRAA